MGKIILLLLLLSYPGHPCDAGYSNGLHGKGIRLHIVSMADSKYIQNLQDRFVNYLGHDYVSVNSNPEIIIGITSNKADRTLHMVTVGRGRFASTGTLFSFTTPSFEKSEDAVIDGLATEVTYLKNGWSCP